MNSKTPNNKTPNNNFYLNFITACFQLLTGVIITLVLLEFIISLLFPQTTWDEVLENRLNIFQPDNHLPYQLIPNSKTEFNTSEFQTTITINSDGYRGNELKTNDKSKRVIILGDSMVFGHGVNDNETFPALLDNHMGSAVEVINAGYASGYEPSSYYLFLKNKASKLNPNLIIICLSLGNDIDYRFADIDFPGALDANNLPLAYHNNDFNFQDGLHTDKPTELRYLIPVRANAKFIANSHLYHFVLSRLYEINKEWNLAIMEWAYRKFVPNETQLQYATHQINKSRLKDERPIDEFLNIYRINYKTRTNIRLSRVQNLIIEMNKLVINNQQNFAVILVPDKAQIDKNSIPKEMNFTTEEYDLEKPQTIMKRFLRNENIPYFDLLDSLKKSYQNGDQIYFDKDHHLTRLGHQKVAETITEALPLWL